MNKFFTKQKATLFISLVFLLLLSCDKEPTQSVFVEDPTVKPDPVLTGIEPPNSALAGIGQITITGSNFSSRIEENAVFFGPNPATVLSATETQLVVQSPNILADSLEVKVSVIGALLFSNVMYYSLETAVTELGGYGNLGENLYSVALDSSENVYVWRAFRFVDMITPDNPNVTQDYGTSTIVTSGMKMGPGGYLYLAKNNTTLYRIPPGGGGHSSFSTLSKKVFDLDFDQNGNIYTAGQGDSLFIVYPDASSESVADYTGVVVRAVRVYNGYVYLAGYRSSDSLEAVWRNQIIAPNNLGPNELVFDVTAALGRDIQVQSLAFAEDGDMYVGTTALDPIQVVHPDGTNEPLYPGVLAPEMYDMEWGNDVYLYVCRRASVIAQTETRIIRINMQKKGAPYYGRQ
jgi:hypothetical protein